MEKQNHPLISVIVPVYNVEEYLPYCLDSIIQQTYDNLEIILINDGSTDGSKLICKKYVEKDQRIRLINQKNKGLSGARNTGLDNCIGEYITFIDSDDYIVNDYIEYLYSMITEDVTISMCNSKIVNSYDKKNLESSIGEVKTLNQKEYFKMTLYNVRYLSAWGKLFHRRHFTRIRFPEGMLNEDIYIMGDIFSNIDNIFLGTSEKYKYVKRLGSITTGKFSERKFDLVKANEKYCNIVVNIYDDLEMDSIIYKNHAKSALAKQMTYKNYKTYNYFVRDLIRSSRKNLTNIIKKNDCPFAEKMLTVIDSTNFIIIKLFWWIFDFLCKR